MAERAIEIGEVAEPGFIADRADVAIPVTRIGQQAMRARKALAKNKIRERRAVCRQQLTDITLRYPLASRDIGDHQAGLPDVLENIVLDRPQPRGAQALCVRRRAVRAAQQQRREVVHVHGHMRRSSLVPSSL